MSIVTDSTPLEEPKDPDTCNVFALYELLGTEQQVAEMRANYLGGNYGYGHAKQALYELIMEKFEGPREIFNNYMENPELLEEKLSKGEAKARKIAFSVLEKVRKKLGYAD